MTVGIPEMSSQKLVVSIRRHGSQIYFERNAPPREFIEHSPGIVHLKDDLGQRRVVGDFVDLVQRELDTTTVQECETSALSGQLQANLPGPELDGGLEVGDTEDEPVNLHGGTLDHEKDPLLEGVRSETR